MDLHKLVAWVPFIFLVCATLGKFYLPNVIVSILKVLGTKWIKLLQYIDVNEAES